MEKIISTLNFEGFYCDDLTEIPWELSKEEIEAGLLKEKEENQSKEIAKPVDKRPWWKRW